MSELQISVTTSGSNSTAAESTKQPTIETTGEFDRFEELTRKLLDVSKAELDEQLGKS